MDVARNSNVETVTVPLRFSCGTLDCCDHGAIGTRRVPSSVCSVNKCFYCLTAHGQAVRELSGDPILGEMLVMNYRVADLSARQRAMLDFAEKITIESHRIEESDRADLRSVGFSDQDIWDIANVAAFFNMSNRVASAIDMRPNDAYHAQSR